MSKIHKLNAFAASVVVSALGAGVAQAAVVNPFAATDVAGGYQQLAGNEGACGSHGGDKPKSEGKCGADKMKEGKCGEGKCGAEMMGDAKKDDAKKEEPKKDEAKK